MKRPPEKADIEVHENHPVEIAETVYWVGICDKSGRHSNPYLIVDNKEAVLIDGGSRLDFPSVMMNILQTGTIPSRISALCYQNYNPRLCGSLPYLEAIIDRADLMIISDQANHMFIQDHSESVNLLSLEQVNHQFEFSSGRRLEFIKTPFAHSAGSFATLDQESGMLFTGDLFSSYTSQWNLFMKLAPACKNCRDLSHCPENKASCPIHDIMSFHRNMMTSERALKYALEQIAKVPFKAVAPQHGKVICELEDVVLICEHLSALRGVGIDGVVGNRSFIELGNIAPLRERLADPKQEQ